MIKDGEYLREKPAANTSFPIKGSLEDKILFALSQITQGSAADVAGKLADLEGLEKVAPLEEHTEKTLSSLCNEGVLECSMSEQVMIYSMKQEHKY